MPTICRKCYVHPAIIDAYLDGTIMEALRERATRELVDNLHNLSPEEVAVLALLQQRLQNPPAAPAKRAGAKKTAARAAA